MDYYHKIALNYPRVDGDDTMPFVWQGEEWCIYVAGWSTLWHHQPRIACTLIAIYEVYLNDELSTKGNILQQHKIVCERLGVAAYEGESTMMAHADVLEMFKIDGVNNPFILKRTKANDRGGTNGKIFPLAPHKLLRLPIGARRSGMEDDGLTIVIEEAGRRFTFKSSTETLDSKRKLSSLF